MAPMNLLRKYGGTMMVPVNTGHYLTIGLIGILISIPLSYQVT